MLRICLLSLSTLSLTFVGCTTTSYSNTARTAQEQLLISNAVDQSLNKVSFKPFEGKKVYLDDAMLECVDKPYVVSSIRHRLTHAGAFIAPTRESAEIVVEPRSGGLGTDTVTQFLGVPEIAIPGVPLGIPEIQLVKRTSQHASAKLGLVAYSPTDGSSIGQGGTTLAKSGETNYYVMGVGPWQTGDVKVELKRELPIKSEGAEPLPTQVAFNQDPRRFNPIDSETMLASQSESDPADEEHSETEVEIGGSRNTGQLLETSDAGGEIDRRVTQTSLFE